MPAELRLHRIGELTLEHLERDLGEFRHHLALGKKAEVAAVGPTGILRFLLGKRGEVGAALELLEDGLGLLLGLDQDVARAHLLLGGHRLDRLVIDLAHLLVGRGILGPLGQHQPHQDLVADEGLPLLEGGVIAQIVLLGRLRDEDDVGDIGDDLLALDLGRRLMGFVAEIILGHHEVALPDVDPVHAGDDGIVRVGRF